MGTYVYSLRKKHVEANLDAIFPIDVISYEYAYKESFVREGEYGYAEYCRMTGRVLSLAKKARKYYTDRAYAEFGRGERDFYFANGGLTDGTPVYKMVGSLPTAHYDDGIPRQLTGKEAEKVGRLFKVGRGKWIVSTICPKHKWVEYTTAHDGTPLHQCERCDAISDPRFSTPSTKFF